MSTLFLSLPDGSELECELGRNEITIGRGQDCDVYLDTESVSVSHATLAPDEDHPDTYILTDLGSTNGTKVNGIKIDRAELSGGEKIKIGGIYGQFVGSGEKPVTEEKSSTASGSGPRVSKGTPPPSREDFSKSGDNEEEDRPKFPDLGGDDELNHAPVLKVRGGSAPRRRARVQKDSVLSSLFFGACLVLISMLLALCLRHFLETGGFFVKDFYDKASVIKVAAPEPAPSVENGVEAAAE